MSTLRTIGNLVGVALLAWAGLSLAQAQPPNVRAVIFPPRPASIATTTPTTWTLSGVLGQFTLSNANLTATHTGGGNTNDGIRSADASTANQKVYVEFNSSGGTCQLGFTLNTSIPTRFGGADLSVVNTPSTGPWYFFVGCDGVNGNGGTATFASSSWARTAPTGFTQLGIDVSN